MWKDIEILLFVLRNSMKEKMIEFYLELDRAKQNWSTFSTIYYNVYEERL